MYCIYLRKSRADAEAEAHGEGETLARHEKTLLEVAKRRSLTIGRIYREIVSGETIAARPAMQELLSDVEQGLWEGVLVMEVERLARGDTIDQGIMAQTFKYTGTKIITPLKDYDPNNEYDEEYFEFGLFMSRREYKTINRRLQLGRIASVKEGKFVGNVEPYGYKRVKIEKQKGFYLIPCPEEAEIVKLIFKLHTEGDTRSDGTVQTMGAAAIATRLNELHIPTRKGGTWVRATVKSILTNPVYIGKICWNRRATKKAMVNGQIKKSRPRQEGILSDGLHEPIIDEAIFYKSQEIIKERKTPPTPGRSIVQNPLSGIIVCGFCGRKMTRKPKTGSCLFDTLYCSDPQCQNISSNIIYVEERVLKAVNEWLKDYKIKFAKNQTSKGSDKAMLEKLLAQYKTEKATLNKQLNATYDLLEQGIYTTEVFLSRTQTIAEKADQNEKDIKETQAKIDNVDELDKMRAEIIPKAEKLLEIYPRLKTPQEKNNALKEVIEKVEYVKTKRGTRKFYDPYDFKVTLYPKLK